MKDIHGLHLKKKISMQGDVLPHAAAHTNDSRQLNVFLTKIEVR